MEVSTPTRSFEFVDGKLTITGSDEDVAALSKWFSINLQALPEGSAELAAHRAALLEAQDEGHADEGSAGAGDEDPGGFDGQSGQDHADPGAGADDGAVHDAAPAGEAGTGDAAGDDPLRAAILNLDPSDDENWTADGKPKIAAIEALTGRTDLTRAAIEAAAPGHRRG
jgi:hypothetical protein